MVANYMGRGPHLPLQVFIRKLNCMTQEITTPSHSGLVWVSLYWVITLPHVEWGKKKKKSSQPQGEGKHGNELNNRNSSAMWLFPEAAFVSALVLLLTPKIVKGPVERKKNFLKSQALEKVGLIWGCKWKYSVAFPFEIQCFAANTCFDWRAGGWH